MTASPLPRRPATTSRVAPPGHHGHLWSLPDGTGLHAPWGELISEDGGRLCCHLCGRWWVSLASHVRVHGHTADSYRQTMGLLLTQELVAGTLSERISARQRTRYLADEQVRRQMEPGQQLARTGQLAWRRKQADADRAPSAVRDRALQASLSAGRDTQRARRDQALAQRLAQLGAPDLRTYLTTAYSAGASLDSLARTTGLGRTRLRAALDEAGVVVRPSGVNTSVGKTRRARQAEERAAVALGISDLAFWLDERRQEGWTVSELATAVGHSQPWVRSRLP